MATIYDLKPRFQALLRPLCGGLARAGVTANQVTIAAVLLSFAGGAWLALDPAATLALILLPLLLFMRMALNAIDGMLAREFDMKSRLGALLNEMGDVLSDCALYLPLALQPMLEAWMVVTIVLLAVMNEMIGVVSIQIGGSRRYDGPFGKSDRAFGFGLIALLIGLGWLNILVATGLLAVMMILSVVTMVNRGRRALDEGAAG